MEVLVLMGVAVFLAGSQAWAGDSRTVDVYVRAKTTKRGGKGWDALGGAPDPVVCVVTDFGTKCSEGGRDRFEHTASLLKVPVSGEFEIKVVDKDSSSSDLIGHATCTGLGDCALAGQLEVVRVKEHKPLLHQVSPVEGCSCGVTIASGRTGNEVLVIAANVDWSEGRIVVDGEPATLSLTSQGSEVVLEGDGVKARLKTKPTGSGYESSTFEGTLYLSAPHGQREVEVGGWCGC